MSPRASRWTHPALLAGVCVLLAAPFLLVRDPPLFDLPVHLARQHILYDPAIAEAASRHYQVLWRVLPNLALDLWVGAFRFVMPIDWAVRLFLAATAIQLFLGTVALNRALFGSQARFGLYAALFVFSGPFLLGLVNLCFGVGMCLWVFALTITIRHPVKRLAICGPLAVLVLLSHLYAFALYGLLLGTYALGRAIKAEGRPATRAREAALILPLAVPIAFYLLTVPRGVAEFAAVSWQWKQKLWWILTVLGIYNLTLDVACLAGIVYGFAILRRRLVLARAMRLPLLVLAIAFVLLPFQIGYASWVDGRLPATWALVLLASINWQAGVFARLFDGLAIGLFVARTVFMIAQWLCWQPAYVEFHAAFSLMEPGARMLPLDTVPDRLLTTEHPSLAHIDAFAVSERGAFVPDMLADRPSELLRYAPAEENIHAAADAGHANIQDYDYVLVTDPASTALPAGTEPVFRSPRLILARVVHRS